MNTQHCLTTTVGDAFGNAIPGVTVQFAVTGSVTVTGAIPTTRSGQATFCYMGPSIQGSDSITAFADTNNSGAQDPGEPGSTATKTWAIPATLTLSPNATTNPVNTQRCVTATVGDASGTPITAATVQFSVTGSVAATGVATTTGSGQATFCYMGPLQPGSDTNSAFADTNNNSAQDPGEPGATATTTWVAGAPATVALAPTAATNPVNTQHCVTATVGDASGNPTPGVTVQFAVTGSVTTTGSATTSPGGQATFCYLGPSVQGSDTIAAFADTNNNGIQDADEPGNTATKSWAAADAVREQRDEAA